MLSRRRLLARALGALALAPLAACLDSREGRYDGLASAPDVSSDADASDDVGDDVAGDTHQDSSEQDSAASVDSHDDTTASDIDVDPDTDIDIDIDAPPGVTVIGVAFDVLLADYGCSKHPHVACIRAATYTDDEPVRVDCSHPLEFRPSELLRLMNGEHLPFATIDDGHGHCGLAYRVDDDPYGAYETNRPSPETVIPACDLEPVGQCY